MRWLLFDLHAPLASFGGAAPGTIRDTDRMPSRSALLGVCAAGLGIPRDDADGQARLDNALLFASRCFHDDRSPILRDYHTAQAPKESALKRHPQSTRRDELIAAKGDPSTVLSDRYYLQDLHCTIGATLTERAGIKLEFLQEALRQPHFTLYVGRKSCPLQWPPHPRLIEASDWLLALEQDQARLRTTAKQFHSTCKNLPFLPGAPTGASETLSWDTRLPTPTGLDDVQRSQLRQIQRRDQPLDRMTWRYAQRSEVQWTPTGVRA